VRGVNSNLLLAHHGRFQHGDFAAGLDPHGGAGLDGPVIAGQMLRRLSVDGRRDLPTEEMRHVESLQWYFMLWPRNSPRLDADMDSLCRAVLRWNGRVALVHRGRREVLGDGSRRWSDDSDYCGNHNGAL